MVKVGLDLDFFYNGKSRKSLRAAGAIFLDLIRSHFRTVRLDRVKRTNLTLPTAALSAESHRPFSALPALLKPNAEHAQEKQEKRRSVELVQRSSGHMYWLQLLHMLRGAQC